MALSLGFYIKAKGTQSPSFENDHLFENDEEDQEFNNAEYLHEVPYTSSSVDRSSIGSIPWADDAIKLNQLEWEKIEKMVAGLETLPVDEDLRNEISDWQKKFPTVLGRKVPFPMNYANKYLLEMESLEIDTEGEGLDVENNVTLTRGLSKNRVSSIDDLCVTPTPRTRKSSEEDNANICNMLQDITLTSVPSKISQRNKSKLSRRNCTSSSSSYSLRSPPTPVIVPIAHPTVQRLRMPPIFNVLESTRKFRNLTGHHSKNPSFVQLTQVQQPKSALLTNTRFRNGHKSAWHLPLAANRFVNNKNSILLPAISSRHVVHQYSAEPRPTNQTSSEVCTTNTTPTSNSRTIFKTHIHKYAAQNTSAVAKRNTYTGSLSSTGSNTHTNTSNSGRSISAAVQYPSTTAFNALYLPYSASKFHAFK